MQLPPLNALRAFEAAARHGSFAEAADELCVTRGAISRHVKLLEEHLGVRLFRRLPKGIELTEAGRRFLPALTGAFETIRHGAQRAAAERTDLHIICPPTTSIRWLIPRLPKFRAQCPDIRVRLTTEFFEPESFRNGDFDLGFGLSTYRTQRPGMEVLPFLPMSIVPACAPQLLEGDIPLKQPSDLANFTLLHETASRHDWKCWLKTFAVEGVDPETGDVFPNLDMAVTAALMGAGVVMGDLLLTHHEFQTGQLVMPFPDLRCKTDWGDFCLIGAAARWHDPKVEAFKAWVLEVAAEDRRALSL
ncbi:LysR substrate-binding domain-containing protein [Pelagibius sp. CAU 1746]|uniref:LysR substrate-binding domain-containing protein n=1 Tax=Pelagibius sp. CAU 1746 TaxID=3140370 RepID=UPI00325B2915